MSKPVDLRSDTVTKPTQEMREAMSKAEVGDDVMGEDSTVNELEKLSAKLLGKEAAVFVASGAMGNLISVLVHSHRRDSEIIIGDQSHIHVYEQGNIATLGGVHSRIVSNHRDGTLDLKDIEALIRPENVHFPVTTMIGLENTQNRCGGAVLSPEYIDSVGELCKKYKIKLHMDGARLMHAQVATGIPVARIVRACDSISLCLSKGLAAPIGTVLVGSTDFIYHARRLRKALGGGWRQAGILAAAGIISLTKMVDRLKDDHQLAVKVAARLATIPGIKLDSHRTGKDKENITYTNMVFFEALGIHSNDFILRLKKYGVLANSYPPRVRFVFHYHITESDIENIYQAVKSAVEEKPKSSL